MAANSAETRARLRTGSQYTRQIVVAGVIGGVALFLGATRLGFIPVPIPFIGNATDNAHTGDRRWARWKDPWSGC